MRTHRRRPHGVVPRVLRDEAGPMTHTDIIEAVYPALFPYLGVYAAGVATALAVDLALGVIGEWCGIRPFDEF